MLQQELPALKNSADNGPSFRYEIIFFIVRVFSLIYDYGLVYKISIRTDFEI